MASPLLQRSFAAILAIAVVTLGACSGKSTEDELREELASLRAEHRALLEEILALRAEIGDAATSQAETVETSEESPEPVAEAPIAEAPNAEDSTTPAGAGISALLDDYREALESEDLPRMEEIYGGTVPADDLRFLRILFERTDSMRVNTVLHSVQVQDGTADALVRQTMTYRLWRTGGLRTVRVQMHMAFERDGEIWRLARMQARL